MSGAVVERWRSRKRQAQPFGRKAQLGSLDLCQQHLQPAARRFLPPFNSAFRLLGLGMGVWAAAVVACGAAPNFGLLLTARAFVGVGEASFVALAAPFIGTDAALLHSVSALKARPPLQ